MPRPTHDRLSEGSAPVGSSRAHDESLSPVSVHARIRAGSSVRLANERTFLAWVRTSLALLAAGVALEALQVPISPGFRLASAVVFIVLGSLAAVQAWVGWLAPSVHCAGMRLFQPPVPDW